MPGKVLRLTWWASSFSDEPTITTQAGCHGQRFSDRPLVRQVVDSELLTYNRVEVKRVATETITIEVDREAARAYKAAPPADQRKMGVLFSLWLKDVAMAEPAALKQMMSDLSKKARERGLTPEVLERLLKEA